MTVDSEASGSKKIAGSRRSSRLVELDRFRTGKAYTVGQAAWLAGTSPTTVRRWLQGYDAPGHHMQPVFGERDDDIRRLSFLELIELIVASRFRRKDGSEKPIPLERIRRAHAYAKQQWNLPYPFANLRLTRDGGHILRKFDELEPNGPSLALDTGGQWSLPIDVRAEATDHIDYSRKRGDHFAVRWFPYGRGVPIVVDPHRAGGQPTVAGRAITVETILSRKHGGESAASLARDYDLPLQVVQRIFDRDAA